MGQSKRERSFNKNAVAKQARITENSTKQANNVKRGYTGNMLDKAMRKAFGDQYRTYKRALQNGQILSIETMFDGPLSATRVTVVGVTWSE